MTHLISLSFLLLVTHSTHAVDHKDQTADQKKQYKVSLTQSKRLQLREVLERKNKDLIKKQIKILRDRDNIRLSKRPQKNL